MTTGIDVSEHQGLINWGEVKKHIGFAILRAGYGAGHIDKQFLRNSKECELKNIPYGVYWFSYANSVQDAIDEAVCCVATLKSLKVDYPIFYDFEEVSYERLKKFGSESVKPSDLAKAFLSSVKAQGYKVGLYTNLNCLNSWFKPIVDNQYLWLASWSDNKPNLDCDIWQNSSTGRIAGISTAVDTNICYTNFINTNANDKVNTSNFDNEWNKQKTRYRKIVNEIIQGCWGNGNDRIHRLSLAGYDPTLAQLLVNAELRG